MKYISAVKAADKLSKHFNIPMGDLVDVMAEIPATDVAQVVRCRECTHSYLDEYGYLACGESGAMLCPEENDYCSRGERCSNQSAEVRRNG